MSWIQTHSGRIVDLLNPKVEDIDIKDIASGLSHICRFTGQVKDFYSVAEHSVLVSQQCSEENKLWGLLHDATEAYLGDVASPLKSLLPRYQELEDNFMGVIAEKFKLTMPIPDEVKRIDKGILRYEKDFLMGESSIDWGLPNVDMKVELVGYLPKAMRYRFMDYYRDYLENEKEKT